MVHNLNFDSRHHKHRTFADIPASKPLHRAIYQVSCTGSTFTEAGRASQQAHDPRGLKSSLSRSESPSKGLRQREVLVGFQGRKRSCTPQNDNCLDDFFALHKMTPSSTMPNPQYQVSPARGQQRSILGRRGRCNVGGNARPDELGLSRSRPLHLRGAHEQDARHHAFREGSLRVGSTDHCFHLIRCPVQVTTRLSE